jgi:hypothetical protein
MPKLTEKDEQDLIYAKSLLEHPSLAAKIVNAVGIPFEAGLRYVTENWLPQIQEISEKSLYAALNFAVSTMGKADHPQICMRKRSSDFLHKIAVTGSGGIGGFFGLPALGIELPMSTLIMLRSIADIARCEGENLEDIETQLACLEVFAFGAKLKNNEGVGTGHYYSVRAVLSKSVSDTAAYITERGIAEETAPMIVRLIAEIASRFGIVVSEKAAASAVPVIGAAGGALINTIFMDHFQDMAHGHFTVRRLERQYGKETVQEVYRKLDG